MSQDATAYVAVPGGCWPRAPRDVRQHRATLVLSRAASRTREIAVRTALGASRARLVQLLLAETAVLSIAGGLVALVASWVIVGTVPRPSPTRSPPGKSSRSMSECWRSPPALSSRRPLVFAVIPLGTVDRAHAGPSLQEEHSRSTPGLRRHRIPVGLVVSTVMLACVLLVTAGLCIRSFSALMATDAGFNPDRVLTASLTLPRAGYGTAASVRSFRHALFTRASALPGLRWAAFMTEMPLSDTRLAPSRPKGWSWRAGLPSGAESFVGLRPLFPDPRDPVEERPSVFGCRNHRAARRCHRQRAAGAHLLAGTGCRRPAPAMGA